MLRPLHQWKLDKNGQVMRDHYGHRIPHPKKGKAKTDDELTPADHEARKTQLQNLERRNKAEERIEVQESFFRAALKSLKEANL